MNGVEYFVEALGDVVQVLEGELTVVELSVGKNLVDQILHKALDSGRRGVGQSPGGRFDDIGQHHKRHLPGLGFRSGISEVFDLDGVFALLLLGLVIKIGDQTGAVVLLNRLDNGGPQPVAPRNFDAVFHVGHQNQARHGWCQFVVPVFNVLLIFDEVERLLDFSDIVIVAANLGQK